MTAAVEVGIQHLVFTHDDDARVKQWQQIANFTPLYLGSEGELVDEDGTKVSHFMSLVLA